MLSWSKRRGKSNVSRIRARDGATCQGRSSLRSSKWTWKLSKWETKSSRSTSTRRMIATSCLSSSRLALLSTMEASIAGLAVWPRSSKRNQLHSSSWWTTLLQASQSVSMNTWTIRGDGWVGIRKRSRKERQLLSKLNGWTRTRLVRKSEKVIDTPKTYLGYFN